MRLIIEQVTDDRIKIMQFRALMYGDGNSPPGLASLARVDLTDTFRRDILSIKTEGIVLS